MVMGKTGMVRVLCLLRFHPKGNLCGVKNKVQINRPFHSYVQVLVKTSKIIYFNTVEKNALKMVKYTKFKGDTLKRTKILLYHFTEICLGPLLASPPPSPTLPHYKHLSLFLLQFKTWERRWMWRSSSYGNTYRAQRWTVHHLLILCHLYGKFTNPFIVFTLFVSWGTKLKTGRGDYSCGD